MRILIAEVDYINRKFMFKLLSSYGVCDVISDCREVVDVFSMALEDRYFYDLVCLDALMPESGGIEALKHIRELESKREVPQEKRAKVIVTTAVNALENVLMSIGTVHESYSVKPIEVDKFFNVMVRLGLISQRI